MESNWVSILVAIGLIILFYFSKKYYAKRPPIKGTQKNPHDLREILGKSVKSMKKSDKKMDKKMDKKNSSLTKVQQCGHLVLHPHTIELAGKEFTEHAQEFKGLYESLFVNCQVAFSGKRSQIINSWEDAICKTDAQLLILIWTTIINKHCSRNLYCDNKKKQNQDTKAEGEILTEWLNLLFTWGVKRELGTEKLQWSLNEIILEDGEELVKTVGH